MVAKENHRETNEGDVSDCEVRAPDDESMFFKLNQSLAALYSAGLKFQEEKSRISSLQKDNNISEEQAIIQMREARHQLQKAKIAFDETQEESVLSSNKPSKRRKSGDNEVLRNFVGPASNISTWNKKKESPSKCKNRVKGAPKNLSSNTDPCRPEEDDERMLLLNSYILKVKDEIIDLAESIPYSAVRNRKPGTWNSLNNQVSGALDIQCLRKSLGWILNQIRSEFLMQDWILTRQVLWVSECETCRSLRHLKTLMEELKSLAIDWVKANGTVSATVKSTAVKEPVENLVQVKVPEPEVKKKEDQKNPDGEKKKSKGAPILNQRFHIKGLPAGWRGTLCRAKDRFVYKFLSPDGSKFSSLSDVFQWSEKLEGGLDEKYKDAFLTSVRNARKAFRAKNFPILPRRSPVSQKVRAEDQPQPCKQQNSMETMEEDAIDTEQEERSSLAPRPEGETRSKSLKSLKKSLKRKWWRDGTINRENEELPHGCQWYIANENETITGISRRYKLDADTLLSLNSHRLLELKKRSRFYVGTKLLLPAHVVVEERRKRLSLEEASSRKAQKRREESEVVLD
eukprot:242165-Hanusia_phi.AAC.1